MTGHPSVPDRSGFTFSPCGRFAACLRDDGGARALELWTLQTEEPAARTISEVPPDVETSAVPLDDGRILLVVRDPSTVPARYRVSLIHPSEDGGSTHQHLGEIPSPLGCSVLAAPGPRRLAVAVGIDDLQHSTVWQVSSTSPELTPVLRVPGVLTGGAWAADDALALDRTDSTSRTNGIVVDLSDHSWRQVWQVSERSVDRIVAASPRSGLLVVSTDATGRERLGWGRLGEREVRFPETLDRPGYPRRVLALDDRGERLLLDEPAGASSRLLVHTPASDVLEPVPGPPCTLAPPASWVGDLVRFRFSAPDRPATLGTVRLGPEPRWSFPADGARSWADADLVELAGAAGPVEAIVYGGPDWRQREHLVLALHGGPLSAWTFEFHPLFQRLAAAGAAVVAPNYRGITRYGEDHLRPVIGNWGGPDLDDVLRIARDLVRSRGPELPRLVLLGGSYGGFLALLAACQEPELWSACVALAPFLSTAGLHESAPAVVRHRIEQLCGLHPAAGGGRPGDVLAVGDRLRAPLLLAHGTSDTTIPVEQSRTLYRRLLALGRRDGVDIEYLELDSDHTDVVSARSEELRQEVCDFCLHLSTTPGSLPAHRRGGERSHARQHGSGRHPAGAAGDRSHRDRRNPVRSRKDLPVEVPRTDGQRRTDRVRSGRQL